MRRLTACALLAVLAAGCRCGDELVESQCSPVSCSGCCTVDGACVTGDSEGACGNEGASCSVCGSGQRCRAAACVLELPPAVTDDGGSVSVPDAGVAPSTCEPVEPSAASCLATGWCWQSPFPTGVALTAVTALAADDVWVAGEWGSLLHFDGEQWRSERLGILEDVQGVTRWGGRLWATTRTSLRSRSDTGPWVVEAGQGGAGLSSSVQGVSFTWANLRWVYDGVSMRSEGLSGRCFAERLCGERVQVRETPTGLEGFAVGNHGFISRHKAGAWFQLEGRTPVDGGTDLAVVDVAALPDGGWFFLDLDGKVREWDGVRLVAGSPLPAREFNPNRVDFGDVYRHAFVVGEQVHVTSDPGQLFRRAGTRWEEVTLPTARLHTASSARTNTDAWLAGDGSLLRFDGTRWRETLRNVTDLSLFDLDLTAQGGFAVGEQGLVLRRDRDGWTRVNVGTSVDLTGVVAFDCDFAVIVGARGTILVWDGLSWRPEASGVTDDLFGVFALGRTRIWAVGARGTVLFFDGTRWARVPVPTTRNLAAIWGPDEARLWAVGEGGTVLRFEGARWTLDPDVGTDMTFTDVHGTAANRVFVSGSRGVRLWDGTVWRSALTTGYPITSVLATPTSFLAASEVGVVRAGLLGTTGELVGLPTHRVVSSGGALWAAGDRGSILSKPVSP
ncbi:MAG: hypothetical protein SFW67_15620 [Myxococcaceae bacterium]|nr:hypothetical protein [Myxococcaceae bacterium]